MDSTIVMELMQSVTAELDSIVKEAIMDSTIVMELMQSITAELDSVAQAVRVQPLRWYQTPLAVFLFSLVLPAALFVYTVWQRHRENGERLRQRSNLVQALFQTARREIDRLGELYAFLYVGGDGLWCIPVAFFESLFLETAKVEPNVKLSHFAEEFIVQLGFMQALRDQARAIEQAVVTSKEISPSEIEKKMKEIAVYRHRIANMVGMRVKVLSNIYNEAIEALRERFPGIADLRVTQQHLEKKFEKWQEAEEIKHLAEMYGFVLLNRPRYH